MSCSFIMCSSSFAWIVLRKSFSARVGLEGNLAAGGDLLECGETPQCPSKAQRKCCCDKREGLGYPSDSQRLPCLGDSESLVHLSNFDQDQCAECIGYLLTHHCVPTCSSFWNLVGIRRALCGTHPKPKLVSTNRI